MMQSSRFASVLTYDEFDFEGVKMGQIFDTNWTSPKPINFDNDRVIRSHSMPRRDTKDPWDLGGSRTIQQISGKF